MSFVFNGELMFSFFAKIYVGFRGLEGYVLQIFILESDQVYFTYITLLKICVQFLFEIKQKRHKSKCTNCGIHAMTPVSSHVELHTISLVAEEAKQY